MSFAAIEILFFVCAPLLSFDYTQDFRETLNNRTNTSHQWLNMFCDYWYWDNEKTLFFTSYLLSLLLVRLAESTGANFSKKRAGGIKIRPQAQGLL